MANNLIDMTQTRNFNLDLPPYGTPDWHIFVNLNFKKIDEYIYKNLEYSLRLIASEKGNSGLRYWNGKLEYSIDDGKTWIPIAISSGGGGSTGGNSIVVSSIMPTQQFGEFWYEVEAGLIEEGGINVAGSGSSDNNIGALGVPVIVSDTEPTDTSSALWVHTNLTDDTN